MSEPAEMRVHLAQLLCPNRHCVLASAAALRLNDIIAMRALGDKLEESYQTLLMAGAILAQCGICGATRLHVEVGVTRFTTMEEAERPLAERSGKMKEVIAALEARRMASRN